MQNNFQLIIFLVIVAISFLQWAIGQAKEKREIKRINELRKRQRTQASNEDQNELSGDGSGTLAEQRRQRLRELRKQQAQRTRERISVLTGQNAPQPQRGSQRGPQPAAPSGTTRRPARQTPVAQPQPQRPSTPPQPQTGLGSRRPVRPGRTARRTPVAPPQPAPRRIPTPEPKRDTSGHTPLPSEMGAKEIMANEVGTHEIGSGTSRGGSSMLGAIDWRQAIVLSEILAAPVSMRRPDDA